jgi:sugar lactone lactonase YvrE
METTLSRTNTISNTTRFALLVVAMLFPSFMAALYFVYLPTGALAQAAYSAGKALQFAFPVVFVLLVERRFPLPKRPHFAGLGWGLAFGLVVAAAMVALYYGWLARTALFAHTGKLVKGKLDVFHVSSPLEYILLAMAIVAVHSLAEEYYWRWFVFAQLSRVVGLPLAMALSSFAFMGHHVLVLNEYFPGRLWVAVSGDAVLTGRRGRRRLLGLAVCADPDDLLVVAEPCAGRCGDLCDRLGSLAALLVRRTVANITRKRGLKMTFAKRGWIGWALSLALLGLGNNFAAADDAQATFKTKGGALCVAFSPDGKTLAAGIGDNTIKLWDVTTRKEQRTLQGHTLPVNALVFSPDGKTLVSAGDQTVRLWEAATGKSQGILKGHTDTVFAVAISADGKTLASGSNDGTIKLWDVANAKEQATLKGHSDNVRGLAFSADGKTLASASRDNTVRLWDVGLGKEQAVFKGHLGEVYAIAFSPDGKTLASAGLDKMIKLWEVATGKEQATLKGHTGEVRSVIFSPDGKTLVSAGGSVNKPGEIKLWEVATGKEQAALKGHEYGVFGVTISADGKMLASGGADYTVKLWNVPMGK